MAEYQGHKDWNHWNVSLWIHNDRGTYDYARELVREVGRERAAELMAEEGGETPDGAVYDYPSVYAALADLEDAKESD